MLSPMPRQTGGYPPTWCHQLGPITTHQSGTLTLSCPPPPAVRCDLRETDKAKALMPPQRSPFFCLLLRTFDGVSQKNIKKREREKRKIERKNSALIARAVCQWLDCFGACARQTSLIFPSAQWDMQAVFHLPAASHSVACNSLSARVASRPQLSQYTACAWLFFTIASSEKGLHCKKKKKQKEKFRTLRRTHCHLLQCVKLTNITFDSQSKKWNGLWWKTSLWYRGPESKGPIRQRNKQTNKKKCLIPPASRDSRVFKLSAWLSQVIHLSEMN